MHIQSIFRITDFVYVYSKYYMQIYVQHLYSELK